jgi:hypothetical protein
MFEVFKFSIAALLGAGVVYGTIKTEIKQIKKELDEYSKHAERLAAIEAKIDFIVSYIKKP